jgi:hypothetical protein
MRSFLIGRSDAKPSGSGDRSPTELAAMSADEGKLSLDIRSPSRRSASA